MKTYSLYLSTLLITGSIPLTLAETDPLEGLRADDTAASPEMHLSLKLEIERAYKRGVEFLLSQQQESGYWSQDNQPAFTALPLSAMLAAPNRDPKQALSDAEKRGFDFILSNQQVDGGIYGRGLAAYNTSLSIMALVAGNQPEYREAIIKARNFLISQQSDFGGEGTDNPVDGGIGYGGRLAHSDLSNTHLAIEAIVTSRRHLEANELTVEQDLDWEAALTFISRCQNLEETNDQPWASNQPSEIGGFTYTPTESMAGEYMRADGQMGLRSYGSMTYAGLLSFIYADVDANDPRVTSAKEWIERNYSVEENPRMGAEGLFYYYHTMAKALTAANVDRLSPDGENIVNWKSDLAVKIFENQQQDGSWINTQSGRWMEDDPILVTTFSLLALAHIYHSL